jgi:hypothetical protein
LVECTTAGQRYIDPITLSVVSTELQSAGTHNRASACVTLHGAGVNTEQRLAIKASGSSSQLIHHHTLQAAAAYDNYEQSHNAKWQVTVEDKYERMQTVTDHKNNISTALRKGRKWFCKILILNFCIMQFFTTGLFGKKLTFCLNWDTEQA